MLLVVGVCCPVQTKQMSGQGRDFTEKLWEDSEKYGGRTGMSYSYKGSKKYQSEVDNQPVSC